MDMSFEGKRVLVTGGTRGIGESISQHFLELGAETHVTGTSVNPPDYFSDNLNYHFLDFSNAKSVEGFLESVSKTNSFDILVNNAGVNKISAFTKIEEADFEFIQAVNIGGPFKLTQRIVESMPDGGRVVNVASIWGVVSKKGRVSYSTSKAALLGFTRGLSIDLAHRNILVNAVSPGFVDTELTRASLKPDVLESLLSEVPLGRLGRPREISKIVLFLCSDLNTFITGQNIVADGGFTIV
jgi:3-oxoacyl-[acyl-carrier protein] reductase